MTGATRAELESQLLDLLVDGPSSFAALYCALVRHYNSRPMIGEVLDCLNQMELRSLVSARQMSDDGHFRYPTDSDRTRARTVYEAWLPGVIGEDVSVDNVGLWYEILQRGRQEWQVRDAGCGGGRRRRWLLDDDVQECVVVIRAQSREEAEEGLHEWLSLNSGIELQGGGPQVEPIAEFETRDGTIIKDGVRLRFRYRKIESKRDS